MIEIEDLRFGGKWLYLSEVESDYMDYSYVYEQLFAQMMGWA